MANLASEPKILRTGAPVQNKNGDCLGRSKKRLLKGTPFHPPALGLHSRDRGNRRGAFLKGGSPFYRRAWGRGGREGKKSEVSGRATPLRKGVKTGKKVVLRGFRGKKVAGTANPKTPGPRGGPRVRCREPGRASFKRMHRPVGQKRHPSSKRKRGGGRGGK